MKTYRVYWSINVDANTYREAAQEALKIQRDPGSIATVFTVYDDRKFKSKEIIDLSKGKTC